MIAVEARFMEWPINNPALSLLMKQLVIGQRQKNPYFPAFHLFPHGSLVSIGQHFVTMRVVHLPKRTETSLITNRIEADLITESDQAVRAVHSCNSRLSRVNTSMKFIPNEMGVLTLENHSQTEVSGAYASFKLIPVAVTTLVLYNFGISP